MTIMVTGGAGFIGHHLIKKLLETDDVICVDNLITSDISVVDELREFSDTTGHTFDFLYADISKGFKYHHKFDKCYHLACPASPVAYRRHPYDVLKTSTIGTVNVLELCRSNNAKILFTSTSEIYGDPLESPQRETYWGNVNPIGERSCYDEGKRCAESMIINSGVNYSIARLFNTYGPGMIKADGRVISEFVNRAIRDEPILVHGTGNQTRSLCYIDDTVDAIIRLMNSSEHGPINIGNSDQYITISNLAEMVRELANSSSAIIHTAADSDDPRDRKPDITLAKNILKWEPSTSLKEGILRTIEYYKSLKYEQHSHICDSRS